MRGDPGRDETLKTNAVHYALLPGDREVIIEYDVGL
jgi:hypothetical protein